MTKNIQIALIREKYEHVIKIDRTISSDEIVLLVIESDISEGSKYKEIIEQNIDKIKSYADLVKTTVKAIEIVNLKNKNTFYEIISECVDIILKHYEYNDKIILTLTDGSFLLQGALHYAATIVKSFYDIDLMINITEELGEETITHIQQQLITSSIWALISTKDKPLIIDCLEAGMNVEEMASVLDVSPGTISNWIHLLEENKILTISKRKRELTEIGKLVAKVTERERSIIMVSKYKDLVSQLVGQGMKIQEISKKLEISEDMVNKWLEIKQDKNEYEKTHRYIDSSERIKIVDKILEIKKKIKKK